MFNWTNWPDWVVFVVITIVGVLAVLAALVTVLSLLKRTAKIVRRCYWAIRFRWTFGLWSTKDPTGERIVQGIVDEELVQLATPYLELCEAEEGFQQKYKQAGDYERDQREDLKTLKQVQKDLAQAKRKFLGACKAARENGLVTDGTKEYFTRVRVRKQKEVKR